MSEFLGGTCMRIFATTYVPYRGHSINQLKGGVIPLNVTPRRVVLISFLSLYSLRLQKPLQRILPAMFSRKLR